MTNDKDLLNFINEMNRQKKRRLILICSFLERLQEIIRKLVSTIVVFYMTRSREKSKEGSLARDQASKRQGARGSSLSILELL